MIWKCTKQEQLSKGPFNNENHVGAGEAAQKAKVLLLNLMTWVIGPGTWWTENWYLQAVLWLSHVCTLTVTNKQTKKKAENLFHTKLTKTLYFEFKWWLWEQINTYILERLNDYFQVRVGNRIEHIFERRHKILEARLRRGLGSPCLTN